VNPYLVTATDPNGRRDSFLRESNSLQHLRSQLERDGYTDIELLDDDYSARLRQERPPGLPEVTPSQVRIEAKLRKGSAAAAIWVQAARNNALLLAANAALIAYGAWRGRYVLVVLGVTVIGWWAWVVLKGRGRAEDYNELVRADARGDFALAKALIARMQADPSQASHELLQTDLKFRLATIRGLEGDVPGALASVEGLRSSRSLSGGAFESRVASIHYRAGDMPAYLRSMEAGYEASGHATSNRLDLAFGHARVGDVARARDLLDGLDRRDLPAMHLPIALAADGLLLQRSDQAEAGLAKLKEAAQGLEGFAGNPAFWGFHGIILARLVLALLRAGRREEAQLHLAPWRDVILNTTDPDTRRALHAELES
jgi:hypothetical protein